MDAYAVCNLCLDSRPNDYQLCSQQCTRRKEHQGSNRLVNAVWNRVAGRLEPVVTSRPTIRPMPKVFFRGEFKMCNRGPRCRGVRCTHPHSTEELRVWNDLKFGTALPQPQRQSLPPPPSTSGEPEWPSLPSQLQQHHKMAGPARPKLSAWVNSAQRPKPLQQQQQQHQQQQQPFLQQHAPQIQPPFRISRNQTAPGATFTPLPHPSRKRYSSFPSADRPPSQQIQRHQQQYGGVPSVPALISPPTGLFNERHFHFPHQLAQQQQPQQQPRPQQLQDPPSPMAWPEFHQPAFGRRFDPYGDAPNPNPPSSAPTPYYPPANQPMRVERQQSFPSFPSMAVSPPSIPFNSQDVILQPLTRLNYKAKFLALLNSEELSHDDLLTQKCSGSYTLQLLQAGVKRPEWMRKDAYANHKRWGYFLGLDGEQIAYAVQASEGLALLHNGRPLCDAEILRDNFSHTEERLYVALDQQNVTMLEKSPLQLTKGTFRCRSLYVKFKLKYSYFTRLKESVKRLPEDIVQKIMPEASSFATRPVPIDNECLQRCRISCSPDQSNALFTIARCPANGPPILIAGAFGTGKTRLLAVASSYFFQECNKRNMPARVLVCTQQWASAESFLKCYINDLMLDPKNEEICIIRNEGRSSASERNPLGSFASKRNPLHMFYKTARGFLAGRGRNSHQYQSNYLVITTCQTARSLAYVCTPGFFTHILLDEGAQTREPEAVFPLSLATSDTKIVIAGDKNQVGPSMLVLGETARENGLATSLLERLEKRYEALGGTAVHYRAQLATNYRCHPEILGIGSLFYDSPLKSAPKHSPSAHPDAAYPLTFVCSSIDSTTDMISESLNEAEADIVLREVSKFAKSWPNASWGEKDLSHFCLMSPHRGQLTVMNQLIWKKRFPSKLKTVSRIPTYDIQGREFRALFLSTSEPTNADSSTRNHIRSLCDRYVFNTALTRAQSLVVSVGNPFMLLKMEQHMVERYGEKGKCWSHYLKRCLDHNTVVVPTAPQKQQELVLQKLRALVNEQLGIASPSIAKEHYNPAAEPRSLAHLAVQPEANPPMRAQAPPPTARGRAKMKSKASSPRVQEQPSSPHQPRTDSGSAIPIQESAHYPDDKQRLVPKLQVQETSGETPEALSVQNRSCNFEFRRRLGKGGFGVVFEATHKRVKQHYAIKVIPLDKHSNMDKLMREVRALAVLNHALVVRYYDFWEECAPEGWALSKEKPWSELRSLQSLPGSTDGSPLLAVRHNVGCSSAHTTPSTAHTPSSSNEVALAAATTAIETSDSVVTFRNENPNLGGEMETVQLTVSSVVGSTHYFPPPLPPPKCLFIQTELCRDDTLRTWLRKNIQERRKKTVFRYFEQILAALCHIHSKDFVHRDLKPSNIFFSCAEEETVKVGDFGLATVCAGVDPGTLMSDSSQHRSASSVAGTLPYMSPEQRAGKQCDSKTDIYSLGVIFFEMLCPCRTEMERAEVLKNLQQMKFPPVVKDSFPVEMEFIQLLLAKKSRRPSAQEIQGSDNLKRIRKKNKKAKHHFVPIL